ncbi:MAG: hypothetical protein ACQEXJ_10660 [Myxococcota bacterium]
MILSRTSLGACLILFLAPGLGCESDGSAASDTLADTDAASVDVADDDSETAAPETVDSETDTDAEPSALALECEALASAVEGLHEDLGEPPEHLRQEPPAKQADDWEAMAYFDVLDALAMEDGWVLDWIYHYTGLGGEPRLYAREVGAAPFGSDDELHTEGTDDNAWRPHVVVDDAPSGYLQLVILHEMADQFYRYWHAVEARRVVCGPEPVLARLTDDRTYSDDLREQVAGLDYEPTVTLSDEGAVVSYVVFSELPAFIERRTLAIDRPFPHLPPLPVPAREVLLDLPEPGIP